MLRGLVVCLDVVNRYGCHRLLGLGQHIVRLGLAQHGHLLLLGLVRRLARLGPVRHVGRHPFSHPRGDVAVLGGSAACGAAVAAASVLTAVFFAQNARKLAESLILVEVFELRSIVSVVRAARGWCGDVTMRGGFAACGAAVLRPQRSSWR